MTIEQRWRDYIDQLLAQDPDAKAEDVERELLDGSTFDEEDPYTLDTVARILSREEPIEEGPF